MKLHNRILLGLVIGAATGVAVNLATGGAGWVQALVRNGTEPAGRMWLSALIMVVIPLIVSTLSLGVAGLGSLRRVGRIGIVTLITFVCLTALSTVLGLTVMNVLAPGRGLDAAVKRRLLETYRGAAEGTMGLSGGSFGIDLLVKIVPRNPVQAAANGDMVEVIFFSLMIGVALTMLPEGKSEPMTRWLDSLGQITVAIIELVMKVAPVGVPMEGIAIVLGVDRILDMCRTTLNVTGDLVTATVVARVEGIKPETAPAAG